MTFTTAVRPSLRNSPGMLATPSFNFPNCERKRPRERVYVCVRERGCEREIGREGRERDREGRGERESEREREREEEW